MRTLGAHSQQSGARSQDVRATSLAGSGGQSPRRSRLMQMRDPSEPGKLTVTAFLTLMLRAAIPHSSLAIGYLYTAAID